MIVVSSSASLGSASGRYFQDELESGGDAVKEREE